VHRLRQLSPKLGQLPNLLATLLGHPPRKEDITRQLGDINTMIAAKERHVVILADEPTVSTKGNLLCDYYVMLY
jgi:hypothetical protein